jgi:hypothetical protein
LDENQYRDEIRRQLEEQENEKQKALKKLAKEATAADKDAKKDPLKGVESDYIYLREGLKYFRQYEDVRIAINHLGDFRFLTPDAIDAQHEYYEPEDNPEKKVEKRLKSFGKVRENDATRARAKEINAQFEEDYKNWLEAKEKRREAQAEKEKHIQRNRIYQEEQERFYAERPGYQKYMNHLGESRWMTEEEFRGQNEFFPVDPTLTDRIRQQPVMFFTITILLSVILVLMAYIFWPEGQSRATIKVQSNVTDYRLRIGTANYLIRSNEHTLNFPVNESMAYNIIIQKAGYRLVDAPDKIQIGPNDSLTLMINMAEIKESKKMGKILLTANVESAKIFINDSYYGDFPEISSLLLEPGTYEVRLFKDGFRNLTGSQTIALQQEDLTAASFQFEPISVILENRARQISGTINVSANIQDADVYLNGKVIGKTNMVLDKLAAGAYEISVRKEGFDVNPAKVLITLGVGSEVGSAEFELKSTTAQFDLTVSPPNASILLDGKPFFTGNFQGQLQLGRHILTPVKMDGFRTPKPITVMIEKNRYNKASIVYSPDIFFEVSLNSEGALKTEGDIRLFTGYERLGNLTQDSNIGPEVASDEQVGHFWKLGYAFRFETPPGNDGFLIVVTMPVEFDLKLPVFFEWVGFKLDENYPITPVVKNELKLRINGKTVLTKFAPKYTMEESLTNYESVQINNFLRPGNNRFEFSVTDDNSTFYGISKMRVR